VVVGAVAMIAGGDGMTAARLAVSMTALQASIGTLNDVVDAPRDAGHKPGKPIPAGLVSARLAVATVAAGGGVGVGLAIPSGWGTVTLALVVLAIGYGYDLVFKGTAWSWLPFAVGIPLLPVYGWLGATGSLAGSFVVLLPVAVIAGAALAIANARADMERDATAGVDSVAIRLGLGLAWAVNAVLLSCVVVAAIATLAASGASPVASAAAIGAGLVIGLGVLVGRGGDRVRRERAWELEAVGVGLLAMAWLAGGPFGG
jgi:4-hydroxybenzoate polyprenyltransferase and related prenyltransferases